VVMSPSAASETSTSTSQLLFHEAVVALAFTVGVGVGVTVTVVSSAVTTRGDGAEEVGGATRLAAPERLGPAQRLGNCFFFFLFLVFSCYFSTLLWSTVVHPVLVLIKYMPVLWCWYGSFSVQVSFIMVNSGGAEHGFGVHFEFVVGHRLEEEDDGGGGTARVGLEERAGGGVPEASS
jgi:hypothetical protein